MADEKDGRSFEAAAADAQGLPRIRGAVERGFQVPGAFNVTVLAEKEKPDRSKPHTDRIFEMLKDMNERDNYFLGEPRSAFVKTRTDYDPARTHLTEQMPVLEKHRAIVAEEGEAHKTCQNPVLNTMDKARAEQMTLNTLSTFELSPTSKSKAKREAQIPKVPLTRLFPATGKII